MSEEVKEVAKQPEKKESRVEYIGAGRFIHGLPARHLTLDEWKQMPEKLRKHVLKLGLYEVKYD